MNVDESAGDAENALVIAARKRREERFFMKIRDMDFHRKDKVKLATKQAYTKIGLAVVITHMHENSTQFSPSHLTCLFRQVFVGLACAASWLLLFMYKQDLQPYDTFMWIIAISLSLALTCTLCCTHFAIVTTSTEMYFFVVVIIFFAFYTIVLAFNGLILFKFNSKIPFHAVTDTMKDVLVYVYVIGGGLGAIFLCLSGIEGLKLRDLSQENFFGRKNSKKQWCPNINQDMQQLEAESEKRKKDKDAALPKSDVYGDGLASYQSSFAGVLDLQQGMDVNEECDYFRLSDLKSALPNIDASRVDGSHSLELTVKAHQGLADRPCRGKLLYDDQLRNEVFFRNTWGTALALELLRVKLPIWAAEPEQKELGYTVEEQVAIFNDIIERHDDTIKMEVSSSSRSYPSQDLALIVTITLTLF